jgi:hypothetical protein
VLPRFAKLKRRADENTINTGRSLDNFIGLFHPEPALLLLEPFPRRVDASLWKADSLPRQPASDRREVSALRPDLQARRGVGIEAQAQLLFAGLPGLGRDALEPV